jgi:hypothetical protein
MDIIKIVDATNGLCREVPPSDFEGVYDSPQNRQTVHWSRNGESVYFNKGDLSYGTVKMYFNHYPTKATNLTDYLDIKDMYMDVVLAKAKLHLYRQLEMIPPQALEQSVNDSIIQWRKAHAEEMAARKTAPKIRRK